MGVDWLARREVPLLSVVGVVRFWRPPATHCSMETMSSEIGSARVGSANLVGQLPVDALPVAELPVGLLELALPPWPMELVPCAVVVVRVFGGVSASLAITSPSWRCSPLRTGQYWLQLGSLDD